ncbi:MAG: DUF3052 domain-containing protein [Pseudomonadota bacterium]
MPEAGYSGTPLLKKLGAKDGQTALLIGVPDDVRALNAFDGWSRVKRVKTPRGISGAAFDYAHFFTRDLAALEKTLPKLKAVIAPAGMIWISWPKKSSGVASTVSEGDVRTLALHIGLVDVKVCAVDDIWSGLKLVIPVKDRP